MSYYPPYQHHTYPHTTTPTGTYQQPTQHHTYPHTPTGTYQQPTQHPHTTYQQPTQQQHTYQQPQPTPTQQHTTTTPTYQQQHHVYPQQTARKTSSVTTSLNPSSSSSSSNPPRKNSRIDPRQIPRPVTYLPPEKDKPVPDNANLVFYTKSGQIPPSPSLEFHVVDEGNCSPKFMRLTCWQVPHSKDLAEEAHINVALIAQPLASTIFDQPIPVIEYPPRDPDLAKNAPSPSDPIRCNRCGAYMNCFNTFPKEDKGRTFQCSLCAKVNELPPHYVCNLDEYGLRRDRLERAELSYGSYEMLVPCFASREPSDPCFLFLIDVSYGSIASGFMESTVHSILSSLPTLVEKYPKGRAGIVTFDSNIHFYNLGSKNTKTAMHVISDPSDGFSAIPSKEVLVSLANETCLNNITSLLSTLYELFPIESAPRLACFGAAMAAAVDALDSFGGKIVSFTANICGIGQGLLSDREDSKIIGTPEETKLFAPQDSFYQILSTKMAEKNISTDLFVGVNSYVDLASIGVLSKDTGGQVFFYPGFQLKKDAFALENDLYRSISRLTGFDSVMVVRSSSGLKQVEDFGNFFRRNPGEFDLPVIDSDKSFVVRFEYESQLTAGQNAVFQSALLFTSESGERKIRIHTLSVPITSEISKVYRYADIDSIINVSLKTVVNHIRGSSTVQFRKLLKEASTETLYTYRKKCASNTSAGQLILPEALKLLPLYTLGMIKNGCLADYTPSDDRNYLFNVINMSPIALTVSLCSPRLYALHKLTDDVCVWGEDGSILLPQLEVVSKDFLEESGIYLLDSGLHLVIWIGAEADPNQIFDLFGISTLDGYDLLDLYIYPNEDPYSLSSKTNTLIEYLRLNRPFYANLRALSSRHMQDSIDVRRFYNSLIEDSKEVLKGEKALGSDSDRMSYVDFLCYLHRKIQDRFK